MNKRLVLFTGGFPYGSGETFLETELPYLCRTFEKVEIITVTSNTKSPRKTPENCEVQTLDVPYSSGLRLNSLKGMFSPIFKKEREILKNEYNIPLSKGVLSTALVSLERAKRIATYILKSYSQDLDHTLFYSYWCDDAALGIAYAASVDKKVKGISRIHRWDVYFEESTVNYLPFRNFIAAHLQKIYSISEDGIKYAVNTWKVDPSRFELSRLGINNTHGPVQPKGGVFRMVSCSNIIPVKRVHLIADALMNVTDQEIEWTHIGAGPLRNELEEKIKQLPQNIAVHLTGRLPNTEVYKMYEKLEPNLFVNVSSSEGVPVSIMEAMSYGIPVLATDVGGNNEIVNDQNGLLVSSDIDAKALSEQLKAFMSLAQEERNTYGANAYKMWQETYNGEKNFVAFSGLLANL